MTVEACVLIAAIFSMPAILQSFFARTSLSSRGACL
jgi:hypothetical protein